MAEVTVPAARSSVRRVDAVACERFLTRGRAAAVAFFVLFALTFDLVKVHDDGTVYFDYLRRLFGVRTNGVAYQIGSSYWNAPFWLGSQLVAVRGGLDRFQAGQVSIAVASTAAVLVVLYLGWRLLRELDLPRGPAVLLLALFGTPLWFYGVFDPSYKHAADTLYTTAAVWFVLRATRGDVRRLELAGAGVCVGLMLTTRYANAGFVAGVLVALWLFHLRRAASWIAVSTLVATLLLYVVPLIRHIPYASPPQPTYGVGTPAELPSSQRLALGSPVAVFVPHTGFSASAPLNMLFTLHRGVFLWTPVTLFATVGFLLLLRRDERNRPVLAALGLAGVGLLVIHSIWGVAWDGYGSFSQRFLTALFPLWLLGIGELLRRTAIWGVTVLAVCACFSVWIGLVLVNGFYHESRHSSLNQVVGAFKSLTGPRVDRFHRPPPYDSLENFGRETAVRIRDRWEVYWRLVS